MSCRLRTTMQPRHPSTWRLESDPADDVRLSANSPHQHAGLLDRPYLFAGDFSSGDTSRWSTTAP